jgi:hypothetical protein
MPALDGANGSTSGGSAPRADAGGVEGAGLYLTNEVFLYRVVGLVGNGAEEVVELEDCYGLDVVRVPLRELRTRQLRIVSPVVR